MSPARAKLHLIGLLCSCTVLASVSRPVAAQAVAAGDNADGGLQTPPAYQDHYIDGGTLRPDISVGDMSPDQSGGLARALRVDAVAGVLTQEGPGGHTHVDQEGAIMSAQWDTRSWGAWSFDAAAGTPTPQGFSSITGSGNPSFALNQRGVPFDGGWHADNGVGDLNEPVIGLARQQPRFLLTSSPMLVSPPNGGDRHNCKSLPAVASPASSRASWCPPFRRSADQRLPSAPSGRRRRSGGWVPRPSPRATPKAFMATATT